MTNGNPQNVAYPSELLPPPASFAFDCPDGWAATVVPDGLAGILGPTEHPFRPNVVISAQRVPGDLSLTEVASAADAMARTEWQRFDLREEARTTVGGQDALLHLYLLDPEDLDEVAQLRALFFSPQQFSSLSELFTIHGTCAAEEVDGWLTDFAAVIHSFEFRNP